MYMYMISSHGNQYVYAQFEKISFQGEDYLKYVFPKSTFRREMMCCLRAFLYIMRKKKVMGREEREREREGGEIEREGGEREIERGREREGGRERGGGEREGGGERDREREERERERGGGERKRGRERDGGYVFNISDYSGNGAYMLQFYDLFLKLILDCFQHYYQSKNIYALLVLNFISGKTVYLALTTPCP